MMTCKLKIISFSLILYFLEVTSTFFFFCQTNISSKNSTAALLPYEQTHPESFYSCLQVWHMTSLKLTRTSAERITSFTLTENLITKIFFKKIYLEIIK